MNNPKKISEVEIKTVIQLHSKADSLDYESLIKILSSEPITKEIAIIVLKKILMNATNLTREAIQTLQLLINLGASFDLLEDGDGCTALMNACLKGSHELACFIIQESPDQLCKTSKQGRNCLFYAISSHQAQYNLELIHTLLNSGVNPNHRENLQGDSCLSLAVKNGYLQISALLLQYGADPSIILEAKKQTLLHIVCSNLNCELIKVLLMKGANPNVKNAKGELPIDILRTKLNDNLFKSSEEISIAHTMIELLSMFMAPELSSNMNTKQTRKTSNDSSHKVRGLNSESTTNKEAFWTEKHPSRPFENINIKSIRKELIINKSGPEHEEYLTEELAGNSKKHPKSQAQKFVAALTDNQASPSLIEMAEKIKGKDMISVPITADFSTTEITIDSKRDISLMLDMSCTIINDFDLLKSENKMLAHQSHVQHSTIIELHNNSLKLSEMIEYLKGELSTFAESKMQTEEKLMHYTQEFKDKDDKLRIAEKKLEDLTKMNYTLMEHKNHLTNDIVEKGKEMAKLRAMVPYSIMSPKMSNQDPKGYLYNKFMNNKVEDRFIIKSIHQDILDFYEYNREQMKVNHIVVEKLFESIKILVSSVFSDYEVNIFGSYSTNLCLVWSDIDIVLASKSGNQDPNILRKLCGLIQMQPWKKSCLLVENTTIPVVKIVTTELFLNYHIDISIQDTKHFGLKCVELVKLYLKEYEVLEPLIISLKNLLKSAGLNDPYKGGLSSYGLILLVVSFLQNQEDQGKCILRENINLGRLFMEFLYYYGVFFDPTKYIIYTHIPTEKNKDTNFQYPNTSSTSHDFIIVDPLNRSNNVAKSTFNFQQIKLAFSIAFMVVKEDCDCSSHWNDHFKGIQFEHCLLKRMFNAVKRVTNEY